MSIPFQNIPQNLRVPLFYVEVDNRRANSGAFNPRTLIIGQKLASGQAAPNHPVICPGVADAVRVGGEGSMLALMMAAYRQRDTFGEVWLLPLADDANAVAAQGALKIGSARLANRAAGASTPEARADRQSACVDDQRDAAFAGHGHRGRGNAHIDRAPHRAGGERDRSASERSRRGRRRKPAGGLERGN